MNYEISKEKWSFFTTTSLWPKKVHFDPYGWVSNFTDKEKPYALRLLDGFTFFSSELVSQMFRSAFLNISQYIITNKDNYYLAQLEWQSFIDKTIIVRVEGEVPSDADSGFHFARLARDILGISEDKLMTPEKALQVIDNGDEVNIVFVDDFVGSGNQFVDTWHREHDGNRNKTNSFSSINKIKARFYYIPVICTEKGHIRINVCCPEVKLLPAHFYGDQQSALSENSSIWRDDFRKNGPNFVYSTSYRAGIPFDNGSENCLTGFHSLGLSLAFSHGWPDATLKFYYFNENGWKPLIKKGVA